MPLSSTLRSVAVASWSRLQRNPFLILLVATLFGTFGWALSRYYHPTYGLTCFLQLEPVFAKVALPEIGSHAVYVYRDPGGYDGQFYAQLALRPSLRDPALAEAIDNLPMRAQRMLVSWIAWLAGAGEPGRILRLFPWINVVTWIALALLLLRIFPPIRVHNVVAWAGLMFSCGALTSVRYALTDLPALLLITVAMLALAKNRPRLTVTLLALATLARETSVLSASVVLPGTTWRTRILRGTTIVAPLAIWLAYVRFTVGSESDSLRNFALPLQSYFCKWAEILLEIQIVPQDPAPWLSLLALLGLTVQLAYFALRFDRRNRWWQMGAGYAVLAVVLGWPTFEGFPGAFTRILLPLHLAFNILVPTHRRGLVLLLCGNLSVVAGFSVFSDPRHDRDEIAAGHTSQGDYLVWTNDSWYQIENDARHRWSWSKGQSSLDVRVYPAANQTPQFHLRVNLVAAIDADITVSVGDHVIWQGHTTPAGTIANLAIGPLDPLGRTRLTFSATGTVLPEGGPESANGRKLLFAVYDPVFYLN